jgi:membrane-bound ClpP family serine protease
MTTALMWAIGLLILGLVVVFIEVFVPTGGLLGLVAGALLLTSVGLAFSEGLGTGLLFLALVTVSVPSVIGVGMHYLPQTAIGRKLILAPPKPEEVDPATERDRALQQLVGQVGRTLTPLLPSGIAEIDGRRVDTTTEGMSIDAGVIVRVVAVSGHRVVVRRLESPNLGA